jgi:hypothetical protein
MSFESVKVGALRQIAVSYGLDEIESKTKTKKALVEWLDEEGVTEELHDSLTKNAKPEEDEDEPVRQTPSAPVKGEDLVLIKMNRDNFYFEAIGRHVFTKDHPYMAVPRTDANEIFRLEEGFVLATDAEVKEYYS